MKRDNNIKIFESGIEKLGRILAEKFDIRVYFRAGACETNGRTIILPALPPNASEQLMDVLQGHLDHEVAQILFTDWEVANGIPKWKTKLYTAFVFLESPRVDVKYCQLYPGAVYNLGNMREWTLEMTAKEELLEAEIEPGKPPVKVTKRAWDELSDFGKLCTAALVMGQYDYDPAQWFWVAVVEQAIKDTYASVEDIVRKAHVAETSAETLEYAQQLLDKLGIVDEEPLEEADLRPDDIILPPGAGDGSGGRMLDLYKSGPRGNGTGQRIIQLLNDTSGKQQQQQPESLSDKGTEKKEVPAGTPADDPYVEPSGFGEYSVYTTENDVVEKLYGGDRQVCAEFMAEARQSVSVIKRRLQNSLLSRAVTRWERDKRRGRINPRAAHRIILGTSKHVFQQQVVGDDLDTCAIFMVDHSGSMRDEKAKLATQTGLMLGSVFDQLKVPFMCCGWSTADVDVGQRVRDSASNADRLVYSRFGGHWIGIYKNFSDLWRNSMHRLVDIAANNKNNSYDGESLRWASQQVLRRPERRKIIIWLNDGAPFMTYADDHDAGRRYLKALAPQVEKLCEVIAIGIRTDNVKHYFANWVKVDDMQDLPAKALVKLDEILRVGRARDRKRA
jgi:hypothetical protein